MSLCGDGLSGGGYGDRARAINEQRDEQHFEGEHRTGGASGLSLAFIIEGFLMDFLFMAVLFELVTIVFFFYHLDNPI